MTYYDPEAVVMPEYHSILYGRERVGEYFGQWFRNTSANRLQRQVVDLQLAGSYALEAGSAEQSFVLSGKDTVLYRTKYLRVWNVTDPSSARILAEIWGSVEYLDRSKLPVIPDLPSAPPGTRVPDETKAAITRRNALIRTLVMQRNGEAHARLFARMRSTCPIMSRCMLGPIV